MTDFYERKRKGITRTNTIILAALVAFVAIGSGLVSLNNFGTKTGGNTGGGTGGPVSCNGTGFSSSYTCVNSATLTFGLSNGLDNTAGAIASATIAVYTASGQYTGDTGTTSSAGTYVTTGSAYATGQTYVAKISKTSYITIYQKFIVPPAAAGSVTPTTLSVPLYDALVGGTNFAVTVNPGGSVFSTGQTWHFANTGTTSAQVQVTITEPTNNEGWINSFDIFNQLTNGLVLQASDGASGTTTLSNCPLTGTSGTTTYCFWNIPSGITENYGANGVTLNGWSVAAGGFTQQYNSNSQTSIGGSWSTSFNVNIGSLASGNSMTWTLGVYKNASPLYFNGQEGLNIGTAQHSLGPNSAIIGSAFTILFANT